MIKELIKLANHLDSKGFIKEANYLDRIIESKIKLIKKHNKGATIARVAIYTDYKRRAKKEGTFTITFRFLSKNKSLWDQEFDVYVHAKRGFDPPKQIEGQGTPYEKGIQAAYEANQVTFTDILRTGLRQVKVVDFVKKIKEKLPNAKIDTSRISIPFKPQMFGL